MFLPLHDENPLRIIPFQFVTVGLIAVCVVVFLFEQTLPASEAKVFTLNYGLVPAVLFDARELPPEIVAIPEPMALVTSIFLHSGWLHLIGNMLFLWVFGDNIEDAMGHVRFLAFFVACGVLAGVAHAVMSPGSISPLVGASGAVAGVMSAYLLLHPKVKILVLAFNRIPIKLPAFLIIGAWILWQIYSVSSDVGGNTAWWAHIGGLIAGVVLLPFMKRDNLPLLDRGVRH